MKPIISSPPLKGFKHSAQPILATDKVRYVGEIVAMCLAPTRAEAEDIAAHGHAWISKSCLPSLICWPRWNPALHWCTRSGGTISSLNFSRRRSGG